MSPYMALIGTPNNYNLVDAREDVFKCKCKHRKQNTNLSAEDRLLV